MDKYPKKYVKKLTFITNSDILNISAERNGVQALPGQFLSHYAEIIFNK